MNQQDNSNEIKANEVNYQEQDEIMLDINNPISKDQTSNQSLEQNTTLLSFQLFIKGTNLLSSPFASFYEEILKDNILRTHLSFTPKKRIEYLNVFPYKYKAINKPYLNNIFISNVEEVIGYSYLSNDHKVFVVTLSAPLLLPQSDSNDANNSNKVILSERVISAKLKSKLINAKLLENIRALNI